MYTVRTLRYFRLDGFSFTLRLLNGRSGLLSMLCRRCRFSFGCLKCLIELTESILCIDYRAFPLRKFLAKGISDLGR